MNHYKIDEWNFWLYPPSDETGKWLLVSLSPSGFRAAEWLLNPDKRDFSAGGDKS